MNDGQIWKTKLSHGEDDPFVHDKLFSFQDVENAFQRKTREGNLIIQTLKIGRDEKEKAFSFVEIQNAFCGVLNITYWVQEGLCALQDLKFKKY